MFIACMQLRQALQRQAAVQGGPQQAAAAVPGAVPVPPQGFQCPIGRELMVQPVILVETGHTFEQAHIEHWLDGHNTCPVSQRKLRQQPPQLVTNYSLKQSIEDWAERHGLRLPQAPVYQRPLDVDRTRDQGSGAAVSGGSSSSNSTRQDWPPPVWMSPAETSSPLVSRLRRFVSARSRLAGQQC